MQRAKLGTRLRVLVLVGLVGIFTTSAALAGPPAPSAHITDSNGDGWLNNTEVSSNIMVTGTYDNTASPAIDRIKVFVVNNDTRQDLSSPCDIGASQVATPVGDPAPGPITLTITAGGSGSFSAGPFNISSFSEGAHVCARVRASSNGGISYSELAISDNTPIKDTIAMAGTAQLVDPGDTPCATAPTIDQTHCWLNLAEYTAGSVHEKWTASPVLNALGTPDGKYSQVWYTTDAGVIPAACDREPATFAGPASDENPFRVLCIDAIAQYKTIQFHAQWIDAAGNTSAVADSNILRKDTEVPKKPSVAITPVDSADMTGSCSASGISLACTYVRVSGSIPGSDTGHVEAGDRVDITVKDGTSTRAVFTTANATAGYSVIVSVATLADCPTLTCIKATAFVTDLAGNVGLPTTSTGLKKDTVPPAAPIVTINPQLITLINQTFVEVNVCGETGAEVTLSVDDDSDPVTTPVLSAPFTLSSCQTVTMDLSSLHDGILTATATLKDTFGNPGPAGTGTAVKNILEAAVTITSPAASALTGKSVKISGTAIPGAHITVWKSYVDLKGNPHNRVALNGNPLTTDANGVWSITHVLDNSGTYTVEALTDDTAGTTAANIAKIVFDADAVNPNATISTTDRQAVLPGNPFIIEGDATDDFSGVYGVQIQIFEITKQNSVQITPGIPPQVTPIQGRALIDTVTTCPLCAPRATSVHWSYDASGLPSGYYTASVYAVDYRDNHSTQPYRISFLKI